MKNSIRKVSIVGHGNVGFHLARSFERNGILVDKILVRELKLTMNDQFITAFSQLADESFVLVCVPDDQISEVIKLIPPTCSVAYTSGATTISSQPFRDNLGVFYPLQSFTKDQELNISEVPFFIEANNVTFEQQLFELASLLSNNIKFATSEERIKLHLAAVFVNNFSDHLFHIAHTFLENESLDFNDLKPLISETLRKIENDSPFNSQTGPARRGDIKTIQKHLGLLEGTEKEIYTLLTRSIQNTYDPDDKL